MTIPTTSSNGSAFPTFSATPAPDQTKKTTNYDLKVTVDIESIDLGFAIVSFVKLTMFEMAPIQGDGFTIFMISKIEIYGIIISDNYPF